MVLTTLQKLLSKKREKKKPKVKQEIIQISLFGLLYHMKKIKNKNHYINKLCEYLYILKLFINRKNGK